MEYEVAWITCVDRNTLGPFEKLNEAIIREDNFPFKNNQTLVN